jgi:hypothetical protein
LPFGGVDLDFALPPLVLIESRFIRMHLWFLVTVIFDAGKADSIEFEIVAEDPIIAFRRFKNSPLHRLDIADFGYYLAKLFPIHHSVCNVSVNHAIDQRLIGKPFCLCAFLDELKVELRHPDIHGAVLSGLFDDRLNFSPLIDRNRNVLPCVVLNLLFFPS